MKPTFMFCIRTFKHMRQFMADEIFFTDRTEPIV